jgi:hypothetical protein
MASITLNRMKQNAQDSGVPMATVGLICGVRPTSLSSAFRGVMTLSSHVEARLFQVSCRALELRDAFQPLRLPDNDKDLGRLVEELESGRLTLDGIRADVKRMFGQ